MNENEHREKYYGNKVAHHNTITGKLTYKERANAKHKALKKALTSEQAHKLSLRVYKRKGF